MALTKVSTDGVKDDAVTTDKLANAINTERTANTAKASITINNNADNRVITGSGTANTLEGESALTFDGSSLTLSKTGAPVITIGSTNAGSASLVLDGDSNGDASGTDYAYLQHNTDGDLDIVVDNPANAGNIKFFTNSSSERLRIASNGNVGIGCINPGQRLEVRQTSASHAIIAANRPNSDTFAVALGNNSSNNGVISVNNTDLLFGRDNSGTFTERMRMLNGGGLTFNGDTAAANALDDYEEGTWSPAWSAVHGTVTALSSSAEYIKIGRTVHCMFSISANGSSLSNASELKITGLPFSATTPNANGPRGGGGVCFCGAGMNTDISQVIASGTTLRIKLTDSSFLQTNSSGVSFGYNAAQISGMFSFLTAS